MLALADLLGDPRGEFLGAQRVDRDHRVDRLVDDLLEAGHVHAGLARFEVDHALQLGEVEAPGDVDDLLDAVDADAGEADLGCRHAGLDVADGGAGMVSIVAMTTKGTDPAGRDCGRVAE